MRIKTTAEQLERLASWGYLKQMANGSWTMTAKGWACLLAFAEEPLKKPIPSRHRSRHYLVDR